MIRPRLQTLWQRLSHRAAPNPPRDAAPDSVAGRAVPADLPEGAARALRRLHLQSWAEESLRRFWPALALAAGLLGGLLWAGRLGWAPSGVAVALGVAAFWGALAVGAWRFERPKGSATWQRLDRSLPGRPLTALGDRPSTESGEALWAAHLDQIRDRLARPELPRFSAGLARRDPLGLRLFAGLLLVSGLVFGTWPAGWSPREGIAALIGARGAAGEAASWEAWAEPPPYTRRPTIYLNAAPDDRLALPEGSRIRIQRYGRVRFAQDIGTAHAADGVVEWIDLRQSGTLRLGARQFEIDLVADQPPRLSIAPIPAPNAQDRMLRIGAELQDDYGVEAAHISISLDLDQVQRRFGRLRPPDPREPTILALRLATGDRQNEAPREAALAADLSRHAFAGLAVRIEAAARDARDQEGRAEPVFLTLPSRRFYDPLAAALIELRADLLWSLGNAPRSARLLRAILWRSEADLSPALETALRAQLDRLDAALTGGGALSASQRDQIADALWEAAVTREEGQFSEASERLEHARRRLAEAIARGAPPEDIAALLEDLREAVRDYADALPQSEAARPPSDDQIMTPDQIDDLLDQLASALENGETGAAQDALNRLGDALAGLQARAGGGTGGFGPEDEGEPNSPHEQTARDLAQTLRDQQDLADEVFRNLQEQGGVGQMAPPDAEGGDAGEALADAQRRLREDVGRSRGLLPGRGSEEGEQAAQALDDAGRAMKQAEEALREGDLAAALDAQSQAQDALREGMAIIREADPARPPTAPRDPLGRPQDGEGQSGQGAPITDERILPELDSPVDGGRALRDEIRRRQADPTRPADERDYLDRLLDRF